MAMFTYGRVTERLESPMAPTETEKNTIAKQECAAPASVIPVSQPVWHYPIQNNRSQCFLMRSTPIAGQIQGHKPQGVREKHYIRRPLDLLRVWHVKIEGCILEQAKIKFKPENPDYIH